MVTPLLLLKPIVDGSGFTEELVFSRTEVPTVGCSLVGPELLRLIRSLQNLLRLMPSIASPRTVELTPGQRSLWISSCGVRLGVLESSG